MSTPEPRRAGDVERRIVQERLRDSYAQGALTVEEYEDRLTRALSVVWTNELAELVEDLPEPRDSALAAHATTAETAPARGGVPGAPGAPGPTSPIGIDRSWWGRLAASGLTLAALFWLQPWDIDQVSVFSGQTVRVAAGEDVRVLTVFGSTEVVVDDDAPVDPGVLAIFGSSGCDDACATVGDPADQTSVDGLVLFGSVDVVTTTEAATAQDG